MNTNKLFIMTCFFLSTLLNIYAQFPEEPPEFAWVKKAGGMGSISANDVVSDTSGNIYVTGTISGTVEIDTTTITCTGRGEAFLAKYNASGNLLWIKQISCPEHELVAGKSIAKDDLDNLYITGYYDATMVNFGTASLPASSKQDLFVAKYNKNGYLQWVEHYGDDLNNQGIRINVDASGNVYVIKLYGEIQSDYSSETSIIKYTTAGTFQWEKNIQASCRDLGTYNSSLYIYGAIVNAGNVVIGDTAFTATGQESFIAKADLNGNFIWVNILTSGIEPTHETYNRAKALQIDNGENIYLYGFYTYWIAYKTDTLYNPDLTEWNDIYLAKFDKYGDLQWISGSGNNSTVWSYVWPTSFTLDASGDLYLLGGWGEMAIFGKDTLTGGWHSFISKYNSDGSPLWGKMNDYWPTKIISYPDNKFVISIIGSEVWIEIIDSNGQELLPITTEGNSGTIQNITINKDPENNLFFGCSSSGTINVLGEEISGRNFLIGESDPSGNVTWIKSFNSTGSLRPQGVVGDKSGNCYAIGTFYDTLKLDVDNLISKKGDFYILKLNSSGELVWSEQLIVTGESYSQAGIITDTSDNIILTGSFYDSLIVGSETLKSNGSDDIFIIKMDKQGNFLWSESYGGPDYDLCNGISTNGNNIIITGYFYGNIVFGGTELINEGGGGDIFIAKLDPDGSAIWAKKAGGSGDDRSYSIVTDPAGNSYISGYSSSDQLSFDAIDIIPDKSYQFFTAKYSSNGNAQWAKIMESHYQIYPSYQSGLDNQGNLYVGGIFTDTIMLDVSNKLYGENGNAFIAKYTTDGALRWAKNFGQINPISSSGDYRFNLSVISENTIYLGEIMNSGISRFDDITISTNMNSGILALIGGIITVDNISSTPVSCYGDSTGSITVSATSNIGTLMYSLDGGLTYQDSNVFDSLPAGDYQVKMKDINGLTTDADISIQQPDSIALEAVNTDVDCITGESGVVDLTVTGGISPYSYMWSNDSIKQDITWLPGGTYSVLVTDDNGCTKTGEFIIGFSNSLEIDMQNSAEFCTGDSIILTAPEGYAKYEWSDMNYGTHEIKVNSLGVYWVKVTEGNGCTDTDTIIVSENPNPVTNVMDDETICQSEIQEFSLGADPVTGHSYNWISDPEGFISAQSNPKVAPEVTTEYKLIQTIDSTDCNSGDSVTITINPDPAAVVLAHQTLCQNEIRAFQIGASAVAGNSYSWISNPAGFVSEESNPTVTPGNSITYILTETIDLTGCSRMDSVTFTIKSNPVIQTQTSSNPISMSENTVLTASGANSYKWTPINKLDNPFSSTVTADPDTNTTYTVTGTGANGCTATKQIRIYVYCFNCGNVILFDTEGTLNHGCSNNNYNNNANCSWTLYPSGAEYIFMKFSKFDIKPGDILKIYDGQNAGATLIGSYDNNNKPPYQIQSGNTMFIQFVTDQDITGEGFEANFWTDLTNGLTDNSCNKTLTIYPNPANDKLFIEINDLTEKDFRLFIYNHLGQMILNRKWENPGGQIREELDISGLKEGIYLIRIQTSEDIYTQKVIKE